MGFQKVFFAIILMLLSQPIRLTAQEVIESKPNTAGSLTFHNSECQMPEIRNELDERIQREQKLRFEHIEAMKGMDADNKQAKAIWEKVEVVDQANRKWLKTVVETHGWPGKKLVGKKGAHHAWLLVQHANQDLEFQKTCLRLMRGMPTGEVTPVEIAYLTDRILSAEGKPQRYGTQCTFVKGKIVLKPVEDQANLDLRRAEIGLPTIEEYLELIDKKYHTKP